MICSRCSGDTRVADSRSEADGKIVRRQRVCLAQDCGLSVPSANHRGLIRVTSAIGSAVYRVDRWE